MSLVQLSVQRRSISNAPVPTAIYTVQTRAGAERQFRLPERREMVVPATLEVKTEKRDDGTEEIIFSGHAAVFDQRSQPLGYMEDFYEVIARGAFKRVLAAGVDTRALFNHNPNMVLGRTRSKTLDLREDPLGLHYYARSAPTSYAKDLRMLIDRGDVDGSSFAFIAERERWEEDEEGVITRTVLEMRDLPDVSPVTYPAYLQTDARATAPGSADDTTSTTDTSEEELAPEERPASADDETDSAEVRRARHRDQVARAKRHLTVSTYDRHEG